MDLNQGTILGDIGIKTTTRLSPARFVGKIASAWQEFLNIKVDMDDKFDILDVLFVVEALTVGYFIWYLWDKI
jgi:hypothetical protein